MSSEFLIISIMEFAIIYTLNKQNNSIKTLNNKILEQKSIIIQINNICENLSLIKTNYHYNNPDYSINYNYINSSIIILLFDVVLFIILISLYLKDYNNTYNILIIPIIILITIFINLLILYLNNILLNNNSLEINNKEEEIINKINEIDNNYMTKLMIIIDNDNNDDNYNYNHINSSIDEYISNYAYLNHLIKLCIIKNKNNSLDAMFNNKITHMLMIIEDDNGVKKLKFPKLELHDQDDPEEVVLEWVKQFGGYVPKSLKKTIKPISIVGYNDDILVYTAKI